MDTSNIRIATSNLADSISTTVQNFESHVYGSVAIMESNITTQQYEFVKLLSKLYSDILDLVLESNDLAKIFYIKSKLESIEHNKTQSQADIDYMSILQIKLDSLNTNLDPTC